MLALGALPAHATLTYDLRLPGGGKTITNAVPGQVIQLELFAVVTGTNGTTTDEGFQNGWMDITSTNGGNVRGNLSGTLTSPFTAAGSQSGLSQDLDGDGDKDLGSSNLTAHDGNYLFARDATMDTSGIAITNGQEFKLADITFTITSVVSASDFTPIQLNIVVPDFTSPIDIEANWMQDGTAYQPGNPAGTPLPSVGAAVLISVPEPATPLFLSLGLLAVASRRRRTRAKRT
jgi:hypothetical protein